MIVQIQLISGEQVDGARWDVPIPPGLQEGQTFTLLIPFDDKELATYMSKSKNSEYYVDVEDNKTSAVLSFRVSKIRHMLTLGDTKIETMCFLTPTHRATEQFMIYILYPDKADMRLKRAIRGD